MGFLDAFSPENRARFEATAERMLLPAGRWLIRRGEPGGDVFYLETGNLEVVDTRSTPELILTTLEAGTVVGEMSFVDESPRSVDVRAGAECVVLRWARADLQALIDRYPDFAGAFFREVARLASTRIRFLTDGAVQGAFSTEVDPVADAEDIRAWALQIADVPKGALPEIEARLRADPSDPDAAAGVRNLLDRVQGGLAELYQAHRDPAAARLATDVLGRELHPWLVRSSLAERCIRRPAGGAGTAEILAHVLVDTAGGDGRLGELLDRWLLDRPTFQALRAFRAPLVEQVRRLLPDHRNRHVLVINAGTGSLVARLIDALGQPPTVLTVVDQSRDALAFLDAGVVARPKDVELRTVQENLARFAIGRRRHELPQQDAIVIHGLLEYLPERLAVSMLETCRDLLTPDGHVIACALGPTDDHTLLDRLLNWPTIRRSREAFLSLMRAAHLDVFDAPELTPPAALLASASVDERTLIRPSAVVPPLPAAT